MTAPREPAPPRSHPHPGARPATEPACAHQGARPATEPACAHQGARPSARFVAPAPPHRAPDNTTRVLLPVRRVANPDISPYAPRRSGNKTAVALHARDRWRVRVAQRAPLSFGSWADGSRVTAHGGAVAEHHRPRLGGRAGAGGGAGRGDGRVPAE